MTQYFIIATTHKRNILIGPFISKNQAYDFGEENISEGCLSWNVTREREVKVCSSSRFIARFRDGWAYEGSD